MNFLRKTYVVVATTVLSLSLFAGVALLSFNVTFGKPDNLKLWLTQSKVYDNVVQAALEKTQQSQSNNTDAIAALSNQQVQTALKQTLTPTFLQTSANSVIDGTYGWLQGKTAKPTYTIDMSGVKAAFATNLANAAQAQLATLPACTVKNMPTDTTDPFSLTCRPPASVSNDAIQQLISQVNSSNLFQHQTINADNSNFGLGNNAQTSATTTPTAAQTPKVAWYQQAKFLPLVYRASQWSPAILGVVCLLLALSLVFAAQTKRAGMRIVAGTMLTAGIFLGLSAGVSLAAASVTKSRINAKDVASLTQPALALVQAIGKSLGYTQLWAGLGLIATSVIVLIILATTAPKKSSGQRVDDEAAPAPSPAAPATPNAAAAPKPRPKAIKIQ